MLSVECRMQNVECKLMNEIVYKFKFVIRNS